MLTFKQLKLYWLINSEVFCMSGGMSCQMSRCCTWRKIQYISLVVADLFLNITEKRCKQPVQKTTSPADSGWDKDIVPLSLCGQRQHPMRLFTSAELLCQSDVKMFKIRASQFGTNQMNHRINLMLYSVAVVKIREQQLTKPTHSLERISQREWVNWQQRLHMIYCSWETPCICFFFSLRCRECRIAGQDWLKSFRL